MGDRRSRTLLALAAGLALAACAEGDGPVGTPGGRDGVELRYVTPRLQVVPVGGGSRVTLSLVARRADGDGEPRPWAGVAFEVRRESGRAEPDADRVVTGEDGVATVVVDVPADADRSTFEFVLEGDRRQHLPFDVVSAPTRDVALESGEVQDIGPAPEGVLLRFDLGPETEVVLVPYQVDADRGAGAYRFLHQGAGLEPDAVAFGSDPPPIRGGRRSVQIHDRGHVEPGGVETGGLAAAADIAPAINIRSCRIETDRAAPLRYLGTSVAIYVDAPADLHQARIDSLGRAFDETIAPTNTEVFGPTTDKDGNGIVLVVMSPELEGRGGVYCDGIRTVGVEIFYAKWNPQDPIDVPLATLAHEHQHLVNATHHLRTRGAIGDERWVNEGLSFVAEAVNGFWRTPLVRAWQFLAGQNGGMAMLELSYGDVWAEEYQMFFLYLGDRFGRDVYRRLGTSGRYGIANIEHVTSVPFDSLVRDWFVATAVSGRGPFVQPRYHYRTIDLQGMSEEIAACECLPKDRLDGMTLESLPLRSSFDVFRSMEGIDADFYRLVPVEGEAARRYELYFDAFRGGSIRLLAARTR